MVELFRSDRMVVDGEVRLNEVINSDTKSTEKIVELCFTFQVNGKMTRSYNTFYLDGGKFDSWKEWYILAGLFDCMGYSFVSDKEPYEWVANSVIRGWLDKLGLCQE